MSDFHLEGELSSVRGDKNKLAQAFEIGLRHCASDPLVRIKMLLGETYSEMQDVIYRLYSKLAKEGEPVRRLAERMANDPSILRANITDLQISAAQQQLLDKAVAELRALAKSCLPPK